MAEKMLLAFGRYLKLVRERRKLSLEDVATLTKSYPEPINKGYLSRVERGLARVGFSKMVALARAYEIPLDAFGEKLALDLEVDQLRDAPDTRGKTFGELTLRGRELGLRGMRLHAYACIRDAIARAATDPLIPNYKDRDEQRIAAVLSHAVAVLGIGRAHLGLCELGFVLPNIERLDSEFVPIVFQQFALGHRRLGEYTRAKEFVVRAIDIAEVTPKKKFLGDALLERALIAACEGDFGLAIRMNQAAFKAYREAGRRKECAGTLNNLAQAYFDAGRTGAARRALAAAERSAIAVQADSVRARSRILLGEIEALAGNTKRAAEHWHEAVEIGREISDRTVMFKAEFQLYRLAIASGNVIAANAFGRRLNRLHRWIPADEPEVGEFRETYAIHRPPKQRSVARPQHEPSRVGNTR